MLFQQEVGTEADLVCGFLRSIRGEVRLAVEEGTQSMRLYGLLNPYVKEMIVCDRRRQGWHSQIVCKSDFKDAPIASILHDACLPGEKRKLLAKTVQNIMETYPLDLPELAIQQDKTDVTEVIRGNENNRFPAIVGDKQYAGSKTRVERLDGEFDHGLLSAATVLAQFRKVEGMEEVVRAAAGAMAVHNLVETPSLNGFQLEFATSPLSWLLFRCDKVRARDRQTGRETRYSQLPLEYAEVMVVSADSGEQRMKINCVPFRHILPRDNSYEVLQRSLEDILGEQVIPKLGILKGNNGIHKRIVVEFLRTGGRSCVKRRSLSS